MIVRGPLLRSLEGREFTLAETDDFAHEGDLTRTNERLMKLLDECARQARSIPVAEGAVRNPVR